MAETSIDLDHLAQLARIALNEDERRQFSQEIQQIINYFTILNQLHLEGIEPTAHATPLYNVAREDRIETFPFISETMRNAPETIEDTFFAVPPVIDEGNSA